MPAATLLLLQYVAPAIMLAASCKSLGQQTAAAWPHVCSGRVLPTRYPAALCMCTGTPEEASTAKTVANDYVSEEEDDDDDNRDPLVPMSTPLVDDLALLRPVPGPPVPSAHDFPSEKRPLFVCMGKYAPFMAPSEPLAEQYTTWLSESGCVVLAKYMLTAESVDMDAMHVPMSEEDLLHEMSSGISSSQDDQEEAADDPVTMLREPFQFVSGNLNVIRAESRVTAVEWMQSDPHQMVDGYAQTHVLRWLRSDEPALNVQRSEGALYGVFCLDKEGQVDLRIATRPAHLEFLKASQNVVSAGPLQSAEGEGAGNVGTLIFLNADDLAEAENWAAKDPYAVSGLFRQVLVAPMLEHSVPIMEL
eukprot:CAMPEP_0119313194 /NCGR_PEP_ID=MMETSP1333-20130426/28182_1 /TAXON_ID=418940 /ORGANISM="Scyphosphaera apsteinii, Strain RCC1455" /LENGTH=361 /DNA_ID=CAMNT_0007317971 /DNA_START=34 /DNA_END=1119 /DNA_ORIENTATION=+